MADYQTYKKIDANDAFIDGTVGPSKVTGVSTGNVCRSFYFNCCHNVPCNGGCCYLWTVPDKVTTIQFEIISGGGSGSGGRCCGNGPGMGGGGGGYATKMQYANCGHFTAGSTQFTICSASTSRCSCCGCCHGRTGCGFYGCPSFVLGGSLGNFCMQGGAYSTQKCTVTSCYACAKVAQRSNCYNACSASWPDGQSKPDTANPENEFYICGLSGGELRSYACHSDDHAINSSPPGPWSTDRNFGTGRCSYGNNRGCCSVPSLFPGGGGGSGSSQGGQCWGDWGGGGLVVVTTWS